MFGYYLALGFRSLRRNPVLTILMVLTLLDQAQRHRPGPGPGPRDRRGARRPAQPGQPRRRRPVR